jgi:hypothetical protein
LAIGDNAKKDPFCGCFVALERPYLWFFCSLKSGSRWESGGLRRFSSNSLYAPASNHLQCKLNLMPLRKNFLITVPCTIWIVNMQGVSEVRVLVLASGGTRQFVKLFSITFCKIRKVLQDFLPPNF